jgi:hypothetical protein
MSIEAERRWLMILCQVEQNRIALFLSPPARL